MLHFYDKFALSQSDARITVAYNSYCNLLLITTFMKQSQGEMRERKKGKQMKREGESEGEGREKHLTYYSIGHEMMPL